MNKILSIFALVLLVGCNAAPTTSDFGSELPDKIVYRTQGYYNAAVALEIAYDKLPACGKPTSPPLCSDSAIKKKVRKVDDAAYVAIKEAQIAVRTPGFAESKLTTFVTSATALTQAFVDIAETLPKQ